MRTRTVGGDDGDNTSSFNEDGEFDFNNLPKQKPIPTLADVSKMLQVPQDDKPKDVEIQSSDKYTGVYSDAKASHSLGSEWVRQDLPSHYVPYTFSDVFFKILDIPVLSQIWAAKVNGSFTLLVDALNNCVNIDIRNLTPEDFTLAMYWIRDNSLPRSSMEVEYTTRYNNTIKVNTRRSSMTIKELDMTKEEALQWRKKGIVFPTVRDAELIHNSEDLPEDKKWLLEYAQYVEYVPTPGITDYSDYMDRKLERLNQMQREHGLEILAEIDDFSNRINHGVIERVRVKDKNFVPEDAIEYFMDQAKQINNAILSIPESHISSSAPHILVLAQKAHEYVSEANEIKAKLERGEDVQPVEEVVVVQISATDFFPRV